jgi:uncharacterized iron-regulated membrane protein
LSTTISSDIADRAERRASLKIRLRRAFMVAHTWIALGLGLYIVVLSVSGSAVVFRRELNVWLVPRTVASTDGERLTGEVLLASVKTVYAEHAVVEVREPRRAERPVSVILERDGVRTDRLFDPYAVRDLGDAFPPPLRVMEWLVDLHDNLLAGQTGRLLNGIGGMFFMVLILTGAWLWWPGAGNVIRGFKVGRPRASRRFIWQLHSVLGILSFAMLFLWAITAIYFAFPEPFEGTIDYFDDDLTDAVRPEWVVTEAVRLHFGRFGGLGVRFLWLALGLIPTVLFATGFVLWWTRVVRRRRALGAEALGGGELSTAAERT